VSAAAGTSVCTHTELLSPAAACFLLAKSGRDEDDDGELPQAEPGTMVS